MASYIIILWRNDLKGSHWRFEPTLRHRQCAASQLEDVVSRLLRAFLPLPSHLHLVSWWDEWLHDDLINIQGFMMLFSLLKWDSSSPSSQLIFFLDFSDKLSLFLFKALVLSFQNYYAALAQGHINGKSPMARPSPGYFDVTVMLTSQSCVVMCSRCSCWACIASVG